VQEKNESIGVTETHVEGFLPLSPFCTIAACGSICNVVLCADQQAAEGSSSAAETL
jgi:hypothetical protein